MPLKRRIGCFAPERFMMLMNLNAHSPPAGEQMGARQYTLGIYTKLARKNAPGILFRSIENS